MIAHCKKCPLYSPGFFEYVPGAGPTDTPLMLVGEAPGVNEVNMGKPFVGDGGQELNKYLSLAGLPRNNWYTTNLVKCRPPKNRDPEKIEMDYCSKYLEEEIDAYSPKLIITLGRFATRYFLGEDADMELVHGIPFLINHRGSDRIIVPCYHPASGLYNTTHMTFIYQDIKSAVITYKDELSSWYSNLVRRHGPSRRLDEDSSKDFQYKRLLSIDDLEGALKNKNIIAIDTESKSDNSPWCLTFCMDYGHGYQIRATEEDLLKRINAFVQLPSTITILHNSLYDLRVLSSMNIHPSNIEDTMIMAYLLQDEPQGLKPLGYRHLGVKMRAYSEIVAGPQTGKSLQYLLQITNRNWPDPEQELIWDKGKPRIKKPQNISKKVKRMLNDYSKNPSLDIVKRWTDIEGKKEVILSLGDMPRSDLSDIPEEDSLSYSCKDAIVTLGIFSILSKRIKEAGLETVYRRDLGVIPMVDDMQKYGIKIDPDYFRHLSGYFQNKLQEIQLEIESLYTLDTREVKVINPESPKQVQEALYKLGVFRYRNQSTSSESLDKYRTKHPIINKITEHRKFKKLKGTYSDTLPEQIDSNNRVHTTFRVTRIVTGRLSSSKPNLTNQPKRGEEGKKIRGGFIASPGCILLRQDYSQIEMRLAAHCSGDSTMLRMFKEGRDIHSETASWIFKIPIGKLDDDKHRYPAKSIGFGILYGITGIGLQKQLLAQGISYSREECQSMINSWLEMYSDIADYAEEVKAIARRFGYVSDIFGRRRLVPETMSTIPRIREAGLRQAVNAPIQMGAQGIIKQAMCDLTPIYKKFQSEDYICRPLIQIHDELIFEVSEEIIKSVAILCKSFMENAVELKIPTPIDQKIGYNWRNTKEIEWKN